MILLIDDDKYDNFFHTRVIQKEGITERIETAMNGLEAISFLTTPDPSTGDFPKPDLIFLDINMPEMNGWEFLDAYDRLPEKQKANVVIMMLTTSLNPDDRTMAESNSTINGFHTKPLTREMLAEIMNEHFSN